MPDADRPRTYPNLRIDLMAADALLDAMRRKDGARARAIGSSRGLTADEMDAFRRRNLEDAN